MIDVRRGDARFVTRAEGVLTRHSFSFGVHYDRANVTFGPLAAHNDELVDPGAGYAEHEHRDVEIVTWVVAGCLRHEDSLGNRLDLAAGSVAVTHAGSGVRHSERNLTAATPLRFVQAWLRPAAGDAEGDRALDADAPSFAWAQVGSALDSGGLVAVASGVRRWPAPLGLRQSAALLAGRPREGAEVVLPTGDCAHLYVVRGRLSVGGLDSSVAEGDAVRVDGAGDPLRLTALAPSEVLVWIS